jgi:hypothetical protein
VDCQPFVGRPDHRSRDTFTVLRAARVRHPGIADRIRRPASAAVLKLGINEWPMRGRIIRRATYLNEYRELTRKDGIPFVPGAVIKDLFFSGFILLSIAACAVYFGPFGPSGQPDPTISRPRRGRTTFSYDFMRCCRCFRH